MEPAVAGVLYAAENILEGAAAFAKGILYPTLPIYATFTNIATPRIPRSNHTISVVKGRAYIFGGEDRKGTLTDNDMHVVILPSSAVGEADYFKIPARSRGTSGEKETAIVVPKARKNHTAVVVGDNIYVYGGEDDTGAAADGPEHAGRIWIFDTKSNTWSSMDPSANSVTTPPSRSHHTAAASEQPGPKTGPAPTDPLPQTPMDPAKLVPDIPDQDTWGTLLISGGKNLSGDSHDQPYLNDCFAFDIRTRTWSALPAPPGPGRMNSSIALSGDMLYRFGGFDGTNYLGGGIDRLDVSGVWKHNANVGTGSDASPSSPLGGWSWEEIAFPHGDGPRTRAAAGLVPLTTGQGREYLLLVGGEVSQGGDGSEVAYFDDVWSFQLPSVQRPRVSAAAVKDKTREKIGKDSKEGKWSEVVYQYVDSEGDVKKWKEGKEGLKRGMGARGRFALSSGTEVDGATVVVWGGIEGTGGMKRVVGDGWMVTIDR
jgi:hypothetical protein